MKCALAAVFALFSGAALAQSAGMKGMDMKDHTGMDRKAEKKAEGRAHSATGTVKSIDKAKGTVMIDHAPVASLNWPSMSMAFKAKDKKALEALKPGQKIEFDFVQQGKDYVITKLR